MTETLSPKHGARFVLERIHLETTAASATYVARIFTPTDVFEYKAVLTQQECTLTAVGDPAASALERKLHSMAKVVARGDDWPRKIVRWRGTSELRDPRRRQP